MIEVCQHCFELKCCYMVGGVYLCDQHKALKQYQTKQKKTNFIKPRSKKRSCQEKQYKLLKDKYLKNNPYCECCTLEQNSNVNKATEVHHKKGRIEALLVDITYFMAVCNECHRFIENNPEWAKQRGYSIQRT